MVVVLLVVAALLARVHVTLTVCLLVAALAFVPTIVMDEQVGARKRVRVLAELGD
jgi:hypothetical protein